MSKLNRMSDELCYGKKQTILSGGEVGWKGRESKVGGGVMLHAVVHVVASSRTCHVAAIRYPLSRCFPRVESTLETDSTPLACL